MKRSNEAAFTIIEVLIALAAAGLIFAMIFSAIPSLTRSSRNNQRKQDATAILSAISQYELRNSGNFPGGLNSYATLTAPPAMFGVGPIKLSFYDSTALAGQPGYIVVTPGSTIPVTSLMTPNTIEIYNFHLCDPSGRGATTAGAGYRDIVAVYDIETGGPPALKCQQL